MIGGSGSLFQDYKTKGQIDNLTSGLNDLVQRVGDAETAVGTMTTRVVSGITTGGSSSADIDHYIPNSSYYSDIYLIVTRVGTVTSVDGMFKLASTSMLGNYTPLGNVAKIFHREDNPTSEQIADCCPNVTQNLTGLGGSLSSIVPVIVRIDTNGDIQMYAPSSSISVGEFITFHTCYINETFPGTIIN